MSDSDKGNNEHFERTPSKKDDISLTNNPYWLCVNQCKQGRFFQGIGVFSIAIFISQFASRNQHPARRMFMLASIAVATVASVFDYFSVLNCIEECKSEAIRRHVFKNPNY